MTEVIDREGVMNRIYTFLTLTLALSSIFYYLSITTGSVGRYGVFWMWSPGFAAILTQMRYRDVVRDFGWRLPNRIYLLDGYLTPLVYSAVIYGLVWVTGIGGFKPTGLTQILIYATLGLVTACLAALGEELGWRGLLVPQMVKVTSFTRTSIICGLIWAAWHYPMILFADYKSGAPLWFVVPVFTVTVVGMSFYVNWLRLASGSLWPTVVFHGATNLFIQQIFLDMTVMKPLTVYFVDDFGLGYMAAMLVLGFMAYRNRGRLPK